MPPNMGPELNHTWENTAVGKLAQIELPFQRMHRNPMPGPPPPHFPDHYETAHARSFPERQGMPPLASSTAMYTVGAKNALGTHASYKQVKLDELKVSSVHLGNDGREWQTSFSSAFTKPDQSHATRGAGTKRGGIAPRLPFSEVERNFGSLTSEGTMPGADGRNEGTSEVRAQFSNPGRQPAREPMLTLGTMNDIGTTTKYQPTPAILADMTHYSLGDEPRRYESAAMAATAPFPPPAERRRMAPAGQLPPAGPSEVEQGFKNNHTSRHYNILTNGPRLLGDLNSDARLYNANANAHDHPVGRKQHPTVNPADRGPTGLRQAYDIITGADRPKERW